MKFEHTETEAIGESPFKETYEVYKGSGKMMELIFYENSNQFRIYIENIEDGVKMIGETTKLFRFLTEKIQQKANEINRTVTLVLDPVREKIRLWALTKASVVVGGWDEIERDGKILRKYFNPKII